ncbi:hypothetical protein G6O69_03635 [Pseudenhygromyxa sp. WMMC2535]|uniref:hypothetical protein n=1 Tax=Pseudenhygromyxa sp. WMMC2535 TaxID=2712867 RepID=UPI001557893E|nr:hypothetical protein [Pseudenhygromyxa sp. WMMC2535]NVB36907.1 hypothetical protein [Pseudenhygromyxa sp. WMMC2535]
MRASLTTHLLLPASLAMATVACGLEPIGDGGDEDPIPAAVQLAFDESCAGASGCHGEAPGSISLLSGDSAAILDLSGATGTPLVVFGDVEGSYLAQKILASPEITGQPMPLSPQSDNDEVNKAVIVGWIAGVEFDSESSGDTGTEGEDSSDTGASDCYIESAPEMAAFSDVWPVLEARCATAGCHASTFPTMADEASAYANIVGIDSLVVAMPLVDPDTPDNSYLWHKLAGTHALVGGSGSPMPLGGSLCVSELQTIYNWILGGALE